MCVCLYNVWVRTIYIYCSTNIHILPLHNEKKTTSAFIFRWFINNLRMCAQGAKISKQIHNNICITHPPPNLAECGTGCSSGKMNCRLLSMSRGPLGSFLKNDFCLKYRAFFNGTILTKELSMKILNPRCSSGLLDYSGLLVYLYLHVTAQRRRSDALAVIATLQRNCSAVMPHSLLVFHSKC